LGRRLCCCCAVADVLETKPVEASEPTPFAVAYADAGLVLESKATLDP
jgi:hypothetical protein